MSATGSVPRWLKGEAWAAPYRSYVRVGIEGNAGVRAEIYLTRKQAIALRDRLVSLTPSAPSPVPEEQP